MCGSNYWTHVRQFFESEAIIRRVNLVCLSRYTLEEVAEEMQTAREELLMQDTQVVQVLVEVLSDLDPEPPKDLLAAAAGYFSGYLGRMSMGDLSLCCQEELFWDSKEKYQPTFEGWDPEKFHALTRLMDRETLDGEDGLYYPSPTLCHITCFALSVWDTLINHKDRRNK